MLGILNQIPMSQHQICIQIPDTLDIALNTFSLPELRLPAWILRYFQAPHRQKYLADNELQQKPTHCPIYQA